MTERVLLTESFSLPFNRLSLTESIGVAGSYIKFAALPLDIETGNSRIYSTRVVSPAINESNLKIKNKEIVLRCTSNGHPAEEFPEPTTSSHKIIESWIENGYLWCKAKILPTREGEDLRGLISEGDPIGISVRGTGVLNGKFVEDYEYFGADFVAIPSTGLMVLPEAVCESSSKGSSKGVCKESGSLSKMGGIEGKKQMDMMTLKDLGKYIEESITKIKSTKNKLDRDYAFFETEKVLRNLSSISFTESQNPLAELHSVIGKWSVLKESEYGDESDSTGSEDGTGEELDENKNSNSSESSDLKKENEELKELNENLSEKVEILKQNFINLYESKETFKSAYSTLFNEKQELTKKLVKSSLKNKTALQIQESQQRTYQNNLQLQHKINLKLASDNVKLLENAKNVDNLYSVLAAYKLTAQDLSKELLMLKHGSGDK